MSSIRFSLHKSPNDSLQHLLLLVRQRPVMHWVLPATAGRSMSGLLERGLLLEASEVIALPELIAQGRCQLAYDTTPSTCGSLRAALAKGRLLVTLSGPEVQGTYSLIRLHETSPAWLLSPATYVPGQRPQAGAASSSFSAASLRSQTAGLA
ncbi:hypothetical protein [Hymenobacter wooponensis]|uniref:Uncharacterized protein n=1 Tax=Hymenobacter wooponensis TaxID=1525360 RepID=A0A4Z0MK13_9BACT|nr:hypothetical protein [Hymenobacter wooponensis]TGD79799.1 hypothetical protein EU557_16440 [Hymenobacter wooponensis]